MSAHRRARRLRDVLTTHGNASAPKLWARIGGSAGIGGRLRALGCVEGECGGEAGWISQYLSFGWSGRISGWLAWARAGDALGPNGVAFAHVALNALDQRSLFRGHGSRSGSRSYRLGTWDSSSPGYLGDAGVRRALWSARRDIANCVVNKHDRATR